MIKPLRPTEFDQMGTAARIQDTARAERLAQEAWAPSWHLYPRNPQKPPGPLITGVGG